jgi:hypothetical protein
MDVPRVSSSVRRITVLKKDASGVAAPVTVYQKRSGKKKGTRALRWVERATRAMIDAPTKAGQAYVARHKKSNRKRRDGWLRDLNVNVVRASRRGTKALSLDRLLSF